MLFWKDSLIIIKWDWGNFIPKKYLKIWVMLFWGHALIINKWDWGKLITRLGKWLKSNLF